MSKGMTIMNGSGVAVKADSHMLFPCSFCSEAKLKKEGKKRIKSLSLEDAL